MLFLVLGDHPVHLTKQMDKWKEIQNCAKHVTFTLATLKMALHVPEWENQKKISLKICP